MDTNLIYRGDCYTVLKRNFPDGNKTQGIDLIYLDPPFSFDPKYARLWYDKETLEMFEEIRKGGVKHYISWMSKRLEQCHRVLKNTGSIYLHCDWKFGHYIKVAMDDIFRRNNFRNEIVWHYSGWNRKLKNSFPKRHETILFYGKTAKQKFNSFSVPWKSVEEYLEVRKQKLRTDEDGREYVLSDAGGGKRIKRYLEDAMKDGKPVDNVWDIDKLNNSSKEAVGYPTQKPEELLGRIVKASSNEGDVILDPMCGCGTTLAVSHKLGRRWIGIDISSKACEVMIERMKGLEGITEVEIRGLPLTFKDLKKMPAFEFQDYICDMTNSVKTQHVGDKGIDGYHSGETPLQIKQQEKVGRKVIDEFETALRRKHKDKGYVIGFSFTRGAYEEVARARKDDGLDIKLVEVKELIKRDYSLEELEKHKQ